MSYARNLARLARTGAPTVDTAQALRDLPIYGGLYPERVEAIGALAAGDGGGGPWRWDPDSTADDNLGTVLLPTGRVGAGRWVRVFSGAANVRWFGAQGDGSTDDTAAFCAAWQYITDPDVQRFAAADGGFAYHVTKGPVLHIPAGNYLYDGPGLSLADASQSWIFSIHGDSSQATRITIISDAWLVDSTNNPVGVEFRDLQIEGGRGAIRLQSQSSNTTRFAFIERCVFTNYSVAAFAHNARDWPYIRIRDNFFAGASGANTIGAALTGYSAGSEISGNAFQRNRYHLKLAPAVVAGLDLGPPTPLSVWRNDFFRVDKSLQNTWDVWIAPNLDHGNNAGRACVFLGNKFGNENLQVGDARILIAHDGAGADIADRHHATDTFGGYVSGLVFLKNNVNNVSGVAELPFIYSYTSRIHNTDVNDIYDNGSPSYICEYDAGVPADSFEHQGVTNQYSLQQSLASAEGNLAPVSSNVAGTWLCFDPFGYSGDLDTAPAYLGGDGFGEYVNLVVPPDTANFGAFSGTRSSRNNSIGAINEATEFTATDATGRLAGELAYSSIQDRRLVWIEGELKQASTLSQTSVRVEIADQDGRVVLRRVIRLETTWRKFRIQWVPHKAGATSFFYRIYSNDYVAGSREKFVAGRLAAYHGQEPINTGHLQALSSGWSVPHIVLGSYHLWIDAGGLLRIKNGAPSADTDGAVVGAQT